jgi:2-(1,2-epoxy-1,2-dihydrophenyl)acetyl-CoA isomerase
MGAEEALAHGLVSEVVAPADLLSHALAKAKALASGPTEAYRSTKQLLRASPSNGFAEQSALEGAHIKRHAVSPDGEEGVAAFTERRPPHFTGDR